MVLNWNKKDIINKLEEVKLKINNTSFYENNIHLESFTVYNHLLSIMNNEIDNFEEDNTFSDESTSDVIKYITSCAGYLYDCLPKSVFNMLASCIENLDKKYIMFLFDDKSFRLKNNYISNERLKKEVYSFYNQFNNGYDKVIDYAFNNNLIKVQNKNSLIVDNATFTIDKSGYILLTNENNSSIISTFNHEMSHLIQTLKNGSFLEKNNLFYFNEVNSIFAGLLTDYNNNDDESFKNFYNYVSYEKSNLVFLSIMYNMLLENKNNLKGFKNILLHHYNIEIDNKNDIRDFFLQINPDECCEYLVSYFVSLHLLDEYIKDKEKGIYLYNKTLLSDSNNVISYMKEAEFNYKDTDYSSFLFEKYSHYCDDNVRQRKLKI